MISQELSDEELAEKFKNEHSEQFNILVRMHLSFVLDLNTEETDCLSEKLKLKKWNLVPFIKKAKHKNHEGSLLNQELISQLQLLINFLKKDQNIQQEGIFRKTGSVVRQQELKHLLNSSLVDLDKGYSAHDCASVFKSLLSDLSDPLLTEAHYQAYCQIAECFLNEKGVNNEDKLLESLQLLLLLLPDENRYLLKNILDLLHSTVLLENVNRMTAENLATLFTPHLLCPRRLSPEQLHTNAQSLSGILVFMIKHPKEVFHLPHKLLIDFRAKYGERKVLSPIVNESISDRYAAKTVFTFVDQERSAKENQANPTETALAQLYAHIQSLPESSKKRKLIKQFNKENGHGTPLQVVRNSSLKNKSFGDSIKKHIFHKKLVKSVKTHIKSSIEETVSSPQPNIVTRAKLFCAKCDSSPDLSSSDEVSVKKLKESTGNVKNNIVNDVLSNHKTVTTPSTSDLCYITSTPACVPLQSRSDLVFTPEYQNRSSMSPITRSAQKMSRAMQETMMTPRSRKPVLLVSGTNINSIPKLEHSECVMDNLTEESSIASVEEQHLNDNFIKKSKSDGDVISKGKEILVQNRTDPDSSLTSTFKEYLSSRSIITVSSPKDLSFSSCTDDFNSNDFEDFSDNELSKSLLFCLDGNDPNEDLSDESSSKQLVLKPKQFDENGQPIVFETSF